MEDVREEDEIDARRSERDRVRRREQGEQVPNPVAFPSPPEELDQPLGNVRGVHSARLSNPRTRRERIEPRSGADLEDGLAPPEADPPPEGDGILMPAPMGPIEARPGLLDGPGSLESPTIDELTIRPGGGASFRFHGERNDIGRLTLLTCAGGEDGAEVAPTVVDERPTFPGVGPLSAPVNRRRQRTPTAIAYQPP